MLSALEDVDDVWAHIRRQFPCPREAAVVTTTLINSVFDPGVVESPAEESPESPVESITRGKRVAHDAEVASLPGRKLRAC